MSLGPFDRDFLLLVGRVAERFGMRPSEVLKGDLSDLLFDARVLKELARDDERALRRAKRRAG